MELHQSNGELCQTAKPIGQVLNPNVDDRFSNQLKLTPKVEAKRKCKRQLQDEQGVFKSLNAVSDLFLRKSCNTKRISFG